jgi:hypothetical protein
VSLVQGDAADDNDTRDVRIDFEGLTVHAIDPA